MKHIYYGDNINYKFWSRKWKEEWKKLSTQSGKNSKIALIETQKLRNWSEYCQGKKEREEGTVSIKFAKRKKKRHDRVGLMSSFTKPHPNPKPSRGVMLVLVQLSSNV